VRTPKAKLDKAEFRALVSDKNIRFHWGQSAEDVVALRLLESQQGGFYVDVGAHHPKRLSNTYLLHRFFGWTGINIDADAGLIEMFRRERPGDVNICAMIGQPGEARSFTKFKAGARSTGDAQRAARVAEKHEIASVTEMVPQPLSVLLDQHVPADRAIDYMTVDIEGMDLQALQTNDWTRFRPRLVSVEDFTVRRGRKSPIMQFFKTLGYRRISHCYDTSFFVPK
jgi:hypothetical protein